MPSNRQGTRTKQRIIAAAEKLFLASGYDAVRVEEIAAAAGLTKAMLYYHFDSKQAIFAAILAGLRAEVQEALAARTAGVDLDDPAALDALVGAMLEFYAERQGRLRLALAEYIRTGGRPAGSPVDFAELIALAAPPPDPGVPAAREAALRRFYFNALPLLLHACLADAVDFRLEPARAESVFRAAFLKAFAAAGTPGGG